MNKVFQINLGGYPFTIDEDAYLYLKDYLNTIHGHFKQSEGYDEITGDIESRLAELFSDQLQGRPIVTMKDVKAAIEIMGKPEDFGAEPIDDIPAHDSHTEGTKRKYKTGKQLFRDPDNQILGGVCAGISAYFGIQDPVWVRLALVILTVSGGLGIPAYLILWAILPEPKTSGDRLSMKGEPVNVNNIARVIEEEVESWAENLDESLSKKKTYGRGAAHKGSRILRRIASFLRDLLWNFILFIKRVGRPLFIILGIVIIIALVIAWIAALFGTIVSFPFMQFVLPGSSGILPALGTVNILMLVGIPIITTALMIMQKSFRLPFNVRLRTGLWVFWILNVVSFFGIGSFTARDFQQKAFYSGPAETLNDTDTLYIQAADNPYEGLVHIDDIGIDENLLAVNNVHVRIEKTEGTDFEIQPHFSARGVNLEDAEDRAADIKYTYNKSNNILSLPPYFVVPKGQKWRGQDIRLTLKVPEGKHVKWDRKAGRMIYSSVIQGNVGYPRYGKLLIMEEEGLAVK